MSRQPLLRRLALIPLTAILWSSLAIGYAQDAGVIRNDETITLEVGDILEIKPVHQLPNPTYTWIQTQDRTFIEANRSEVYRKRQIQPGRYTLYAEITAGDQSMRISRTFFLDYKPRVVSSAAATDDAAATLVSAMPALDQNGRSILPEGSQLIRLEPRNPETKPLALDLDLQADQNGDGNTINDVQGDETFFQSDATPIYLWLAEPTDTRSISVTAIGTDGTPVVQKIDILSEGYARAQGLVVSPIRMDIRPIGNLEYAYSATFLSNPPTTPILHHWDFGDDQKSILPNPNHTYAEPRTYHVSVRIQNLTNGKEIAFQEQELVVEGSIAPVASASSEPATAEDPVSPDEPEQPADSSSFMNINSIALLGGIFLGSVLFGVIIIALIMKLRGKSGDMSEHFAAMEANIIGKEGGAPPPLTIASPAPAPGPSKDDVVRREVDHATTNPLQEKPLKIEEGNAPSWLKSGISGTTPTKPATPAPAKAPDQAAAPTPAPAAATPPWLQKTAPTPTQPAPAPAPAKPQAAAPATTPVAKPAPQPSSPTPPWLQGKPAQAPAPAPSAPASQPKPVVPPAQPATAPAKASDKPAAPSPASQPAPKPTAPAAAPAPAPAPQTTTKQAAPASAPAPSVPATQPAVSAPAPKTPAPPVQPSVQQPAKVAEKPAVPVPTPQPPQAPAQRAAALQPSSPAPAPQPKPVASPSIPAVSASPAPQKQEDQPIAFIRADSLEKKPEQAPQGGEEPQK